MYVCRLFGTLLIVIKYRKQGILMFINLPLIIVESIRTNHTGTDDVFQLNEFAVYLCESFIIIIIED